MQTSKPSLAILLACSFAFIIVQLDVTIVNVALPQIGAELGARISDLQWVVDAYTLGFAVFLLSAGVLGDKFGSRRVFMAGFGLFTLASIACAAAPGAIVLNVARAAQGIGAAALVPSSLAILNAAYAHDKKLLAKAISLWTAAGGLSIAAGPVLGGLLLSALGWRSIFWVNVPICVAGFWLTSRVVPAFKGKDPHRSFDLPGQLLAVIALTALIGAVIEVESLGIDDWRVLCALVVSVIATTLFLIVEQRGSAPMMPLGLFRQAAFSAAVLYGVMVNVAYYGVIFVLSFYLQKLRGFTVLHAGLIFLPLTATFIVSNIISGMTMARIGVRTPMIVGGAIGAFGYALLGLIGVSENASFLQMLPGLALIPAGMGLGVPAMTTSILSAVPPQQAGTASAVLNTARQVGGAIGVAVFGALVATGSNAHMLAGIHIAMGVSALLLLTAALLSYLYVARPAAVAAVAAPPAR